MSEYSERFSQPEPSTQPERLAQLEAENRLLRDENEQLKTEPRIISTQACVSCGNQTIYLCLFDKQPLCGEIVCRVKHEQTGTCAGLRK